MPNGKAKTHIIRHYMTMAVSAVLTQPLVIYGFYCLYLTNLTVVTPEAFLTLMTYVPDARLSRL